MKKKILVPLLILGFCAGCGKIPQMANGADALVSFDDSKNAISATELYDAIKKNYGLTKLIDMIDNKILLVKYPDNEDKAKDYVEDQMTQIKKYYVDDNGKYDESSLLSALSQYYGINTIAEFEETLRLSYYRNLAVEDYAKAQVTDKQINKYYEDEVVGDIECSHILISIDVKDDAKEEEKTAADEAALKKAKDIIKELDNGAKFEELAKKYSKDEATATKGGTLGYFNKGSMVEAFETAAYKLKLNEYTKTPVKSTYGYHIILKTGEKEKASLEDSKKTIVEKLGKELQDSDKTLSINALVDLRKEYGMEIEDSELAKQYSTYISNQLLQASQTTTTTTAKK